MEPLVNELLKRDDKMHKYLRSNSEWYKYLNRNPGYYQNFIDVMRIKYKLRPTDKVRKVLDNVDLISNILKMMK